MKIKKITNIGKREVVQIEVKRTEGDKLTNSYVSNKCVNKNCNGPHVPLVVVDEIDTLSGEGLKAFKEISGMLDSKNGKKALRVGISTRKSRYGLMNHQIENAEAEHRFVLRWTAFEFTERCTDERSGTRRTDAYMIQDDMEVISPEVYNLKDPKKQNDYQKITLPGEKCMECPLAAICLGDAKNQVAQTPMLKTIDELQQKVRTEGADWALAQLMNLKPSLEGIVYKEFDEKKHVLTWNEMWYKLTHTEFPGECNQDIFVKKCHQMKLPCYGGIDWGWRNPCTVVYYFLDKLDNVYIVQTDGMTYISQPEWIHKIKYKYHSKFRCQLYFPDTADQGAVHEMRKAGLPVSIDNKDKNINTGIQIIKKCLRVPGGQDAKMFMTVETAQPLIEEFQMYHFKTNAAGDPTDDPDSESDHWLDALRYAISHILGKGGLIVADLGGLDKDKVMDKAGNYLQAPTAAEYAEINQLQFDDDMDTSKIGKVGRLSELDDDEDDLGGDGGFLWSV